MLVSVFGIAVYGDEGHAPVVRITAPTDQQFLSGIVHVTVEATPRQGIDQVSVSADGTLLGLDTSPPYDVTWDTRLDADGPYDLVARAQGQGFGGATSPRLAVTVDNTPPVVKWVAPQDGQFVVGAVRLEVEPYDLLGLQAVRFLVNGVAVGEAASPPYVFDWDTLTLPNIRCALEARAFDRAGNSATSPAMTVKVSNRNSYPFLEPIGSQAVLERSTLVFSVTASDADGDRDPLTYAVVHLPPWAEFNPETREFRGTPGRAEASAKQPRKDYPNVRFQVCDPEPLCDSEEITITVVHHNTPPILQSPGDQTLEEEKPLHITLVTTDSEEDPLTCRAASLPKWATFDESTCTAGGTPGLDVATVKEPKTVYSGVGFEVCDTDSLCVTQKITITVLDVQNRPPAFDPIGNPVVDEGTLVKFSVVARDPDGETPLLTVTSPLPVGATFTSDQRGGTERFEWTPRFDQSGTYTLTFAATDGAVVATQEIQVTVREVSLAISGVIRDSLTELPLLGATVEISTTAGTVNEVTTDERGSYLAAGLERRAYQINPSYHIDRPFSTTGGSLTGVTFSPSSKRVTLSDRDATGVDFMATPP